jgi:drug/metabolite transporter (DMT)-like permease
VALSLGLPYAELPPTFSVRDGLFLVVLGLLAGIGHWLLIGAFLRAPASLIAPFTYVQMIWATLFGFAVFGQLPDGVSAAGMAVIVASGVALVIHERRGLPPRARGGRAEP